MTRRNTPAFITISLLLVLGNLISGASAEETPTITAKASTDATLDTVELTASVLKTDNYPVDLGTVLKLVEDQNLLIGQGEKNTDIFKSRYRQRQAALLPSIEGTYTQSRLEGGQQVFGDVVTVVRTTVQPQLTASWTLYPGGRNVYEMLAARRRQSAAESLLKETYQEQLARATEEYYQLLAAYKQKDVAIRSLAEARGQVELNEAMVRVGKGIPLDLSRARTTFSQQQTSLVQAENAIIQAEQTLLNRLNLDATIHLVPSEEEARRNPLVPASIAVTELIKLAVSQNPAIRTGEEELKALGLDYKTVRSDLIPSLTLRSYINGTGPERGELTRTTFGGLTVNMNLLQNMGLQVPFRLQEQKRLVEQKVLAQRQLVRNVESQVMRAFLSSENYKMAMDAAQLELASAEESYQLAVGRFKAGYGINLDVLDAEAALFTARGNLTQAVLNYNQAQVQLVEALGQVTPETLIHGLNFQGKASNGNNTNPS